MFITIAVVIGFVASIVLIPWIIVQIPSDYFTHYKRQKYLWEGRLPITRRVFLFLKNVVGVLFIIAGVAMLFLPGEGILTIIVGLFFVDFPYRAPLNTKFKSGSSDNPKFLKWLTGCGKKQNEVHRKYSPYHCRGCRAVV